MNWTKRFERARKNNGKFTNADVRASSSNRQCALGEVLHSIGYRQPHSFFSVERVVRKEDIQLWEKACQFNRAVLWDQVAVAETIYSEIHQYPISKTLKNRLRIDRYTY